MEEATMLKISMMTAILGVVALFLIMSFTEIEERSVSDVLQSKDEKVKAAGKVISYEKRGAVSVVELAEEKIESIDAVIFDDVNLSSIEGKKVVIIGSLDEYQGKKQLIVESIKEEK